MSTITFMKAGNDKTINGYNLDGDKGDIKCNFELYNLGANCSKLNHFQLGTTTTKCNVLDNNEAFVK